MPPREQVLCGHDRMQSVYITSEVCEFDIDRIPITKCIDTTLLYTVCQGLTVVQCFSLYNLVSSMIYLN